MNKLLLVLLTLVPNITFAAIDVQEGKVEKLLTDQASFGKCMINSPGFSPSNNCRAGWVSLDCDGVFMAKEDSRRMWESAQMAFALGETVKVWINDAKKINGWCLIDRIDVLK